MIEMIVIGEAGSTTEEFPYRGIFVGTYDEFSRHFGSTNNGDRDRVIEIARRLGAYAEFNVLNEEDVTRFYQELTGSLP